MFFVRYEMNFKYKIAKKLIEEDAPFLNKYMSRKEQKSSSWISRRPKATNASAGESHQQSNLPIDRSVCELRGQKADTKI